MEPWRIVFKMGWAMGEDLHDGAAVADTKATPIEVLAQRRPVLFAQFDEVSANPRLGGATIVMRRVCIACFDLRLLVERFADPHGSSNPCDQDGSTARSALKLAAAAAGMHVGSWDWSPSPSGVWGLMARIEREVGVEADSHVGSTQQWSEEVGILIQGWGAVLAGPEPIDEWGMGGLMGRPVLPWLRMLERHGWAGRVAASLERLELDGDESGRSGERGGSARL